MVGIAPAGASGEPRIDFAATQRGVIPVEAADLEGITRPAASTAAKAERQTRADQSLVDAAKSRTAGLLRVGPNHALKFPSEAARLAEDGDVVEIAAGHYQNDYATWNQDRLSIRGVGGMAHFASEGWIPNGKAIWIINGDDVSLENLEFSGASVADNNGAGIRHQGGNLRLRNSFFHDNEFSILAGRLPNADITIESSRFWFQRRRDRFSHGIYIGDVRRLTLIGNHFKGTDRGHQVKSRAFENRILYNRIEDIAAGNSSRLIDLPNCGLSLVMGNDLQQAATSENLNAIGYGAEGCDQRNERQRRLYVVNNSFINEATGGDFVRNFAGGDVIVANNLIFGRGRFLRGRGTERGNVRLSLDGASGRTWAAPPGSAAIDQALDLLPVDGVDLVPTLEFSPPVGTRKRTRVDRLDVGSREAAH